MFLSKHLHFLFTVLFFLANFATAWPWPIRAIVVRQDSGDNSMGAVPAATSTTAKDTASASKTVYSGSVINSNIASDSATVSSGGSTTKRPAATATTSYDARLPAGGITLLTPAATETSYVKVGDSVTFAWNFTSLSATPTALNIMATCTLNSQLYTIAMNQSVETTSAIWDTGATTTLNFPVASYTLMIYDSASSVTAAPRAGYLAAYTGYKFGMYTPQAYTPLSSGYVCATCSGALSHLEQHALGTVVVMGTVTVLSFTWFIGGVNIIW